MDAFWDCTSALFVQPGHLKATFRLAKAHATMSKYEEAKEVLEKSAYTTMPEFQAEVSRLNRLSRQQQFGEYDLKSLLKEAAALKTPRLDIADFNGGVEVQWISKEKGNGLVALRDFAPGDLLFVNKAFETAYKSEGNMANVCINAAAAEERIIQDSCDNECLSRIIRRTSKNEDLRKELYQLYAGPKFKRFEDDEGQPPVFDTSRVAAIVHFNALGLGDLHNHTPLKGGLQSFEAVRSGFTFGGSGVWLLASFMNHSCVPNTVSFFVGDLMFVRASKRITKGEELTTSYSSGACNYKQRQQVFAGSYGFTCKCELCFCDLQRARDQPDLDMQREAAMESFRTIELVNYSNVQFFAAVEDLRTIAEKFSSRLAYKDRYDVNLQTIYKSLGKDYICLEQWLKAAKAFEMAYIAAVGNGIQTTGSFRYDSLFRETMFLCFNVAYSYMRCQEFAKAKEYLCKMQQAAKISMGSDDVELLAMFYPVLPIATVFKCLTARN